MKEPIFEKIVDKFDELKFEAYSYTDTEKVKIAKFKLRGPNFFKETGDILKKHKWKFSETLKNDLYKLHKPNHQHFFISSVWDNYINEYIEVIYDKFYDRVSIRSIASGYKMSHLKNRYFPIIKKRPVLCLSKHLYMFTKVNNKCSPRIYKNFHVHSLAYSEREALKIMLDTQCEVDNLPNVSYKHFMGAKNTKEVFKRAYGIDVPKSVLKVYKPDDINYVLKVLDNPNDITKFAMHLATLPKDSTSFQGIYYHSSLIFDHLCQMKNLGDYSWLLRDYFGDLHHFKLKTNLSFTNIDRIRELHNRYTRVRMLEGVPEIKVHNRFVDLVKSFSIECEMVDTKDRLIEEGATMEHCVATYHGQINSGQCCIVHIPYKDTPGYTLQIVGGTDGQIFKVAQLRGKFNCEPPEELTTKIKDMITDYVMDDLRGSFKKIESEMQIPVIN